MPGKADFWGKLVLEESQGRVIDRLSLADHSIDVACVFRQLCERPAIRRNLELASGTSLNSTALDRLAVIVLFHDLGKCNWGFQSKEYPRAKNTAGHIREVLPLFFDKNLLPLVRQALDIETLAQWFSPPENISQMLLAAVSHHGRPAFTWKDGESLDVLRLARFWRVQESLDPIGGLRNLGETARHAFPGAYQNQADPIPVTVALEHCFAGLVMLADWLGSHREAFFPFHHQGDRAEWAKERAISALAAVGLDVSEAKARLANAPLDFFKTFGFDPRPLQARLSRLDLPPLLIAESETGSGKTEAALAHFLALFRAGIVDSLYFALPTQVAARELYNRILLVMTHVFGHVCPPVVLAVPGYARVDGEPKDKLPSETSLHHEDDLVRRERGWAAERPKRFLAAPIAIGTIDQALLSAMQVPHAHLRKVCLNRALLVIDEVHSSDVYMRALSRRMLARHLAAGGRALLLSATLGSAARAEYLSPDQRPAFEPYETAVQQAYPAISAPNRPIEAMTDLSGLKKRVRIEPLSVMERLESLIPCLIEALDHGLRMLVILNTVTRALALTRQVENTSGLAEVLFNVEGIRCPHHGRFAKADRELLDQAVTAQFGRNSPAGPLLLIGTQTLEQSLDIDADQLISDLCPMDVLLQRMGRLQRHDRGPRPEAVCTVLLPDVDDFSTFMNTKGEARSGGALGLGSVYEDLRILQLTRDLAAQAPVFELPTDNRRLVESVTHPERLADLQGEKWNRHGQHIEGLSGAKSMAAHTALIPDEHFGEFSFPSGLEERLSTRLGLNDRRLWLVNKYTSPFGQMIDELTIPGHLAQGLDQDQADSVEVREDGLFIRAGQLAFRYTRFGLEKDDESAD